MCDTVMSESLLTLHSQLCYITYQAHVPFTATYILLHIVHTALETVSLAMNMPSGGGVPFSIASTYNL